MTPTEWFDQFPPADNWPTESQWCARHWAPCPVLGANGIGAATELMKIWLEEQKPTDLGPGDTEALNRAMVADAPVCCALGDERMYALWGHWGPEEDLA